VAGHTASVFVCFELLDTANEVVVVVVVVVPGWRPC
jgi:hypothetical protein